MRFLRTTVAGVSLLLLSAKTSAQSITLTGTVYAEPVASSDSLQKLTPARSSTTRVYLLRLSEYSTFHRCAEKRSSAVPCIEMVSPRFAAVDDNGRYRFDDVIDGAEYYLIGLSLRTGRATSMHIFVMGDMEQDLWMN